MRNFNDWELNIVVSFLHLLQSHLHSRKVDGGLRWSLKKKGIFDIRSFYMAFKGFLHCSLPLEEYLANQSSSLGMFLSMDGSVEQDPDL